MFCLVIVWNLKHNCHFTRIIVLTKNVTQGNRLLKSNLYVAYDSNSDHVDFFSYWKSTILKVCVFFSVKQSWLPYATFLSIEFQFWTSFFLLSFLCLDGIRILQPNGYVLLRDYAIGDYAQVSFQTSYGNISNEYIVQ